MPSILMVTNTSDPSPVVSGDGSLRGEIAAAASGDTIEFAGSVYGQTITLNQQNGSLEISQSLNIEAPPGNPVVISGNHTGLPRFYSVFIIDSGTVVTLSGLTITGASGFFGGGIDNEGTLTVSHCTVSNNTALHGGAGIFNDIGAMLTVNQSTLSDNHADVGRGGGIMNVGTATVSNSMLSGNSAGLGGGIWNGGFFNGGIVNSPTATVSNSTLSQNTANEGGGIYNGGTLSILHQSTIRDNSAASRQGADLLNDKTDGGSFTIDASSTVRIITTI